MQSRIFIETHPFFIVFDKHERVIETLRAFAQREDIRGGRFAAIGALSSATVAYWNPQKRDYEHIEVSEQVEVLSLLGDVTVAGGETKIHAHIVLGRRDGSTIGGHLIEGTVYPTLEMHFVDYDSTLQRHKDEETKLSLIVLNGDEKEEER